MRERMPSLNIIRPVTNIGEDDLAYLQRDLYMRNEHHEGMEEHIMKIFRSIGSLRATVVSHGEIERLQRSLPPATLGDRRLPELAAHIASILPDFSRQALVVPTLPARNEMVIKGRKRRVLTIAGSPEVSQERFLIKESIRDFYDLPAIPPGVWLDDTATSRVRIARSKSVVGNCLIDQLAAALQVGNTLLPAVTELGPIEIRTVP